MRVKIVKADPLSIFHKKADLETELDIGLNFPKVANFWKGIPK
jgi:hypothetical protein